MPHIHHQFLFLVHKPWSRPSTKILFRVHDHVHPPIPSPSPAALRPERQWRLVFSRFFFGRESYCFGGGISSVSSAISAQSAREISTNPRVWDQASDYLPSRYSSCRSPRSSTDRRKRFRVRPANVRRPRQKVVAFVSALRFEKSEAAIDEEVVHGVRQKRIGLDLRDDTAWQLVLVPTAVFDRHSLQHEHLRESTGDRVGVFRIRWHSNRAETKLVEPATFPDHERIRTENFLDIRVLRRLARENETKNVVHDSRVATPRRSAQLRQFPLISSSVRLAGSPFLGGRGQSRSDVNRQHRAVVSCSPVRMRWVGSQRGSRPR